MGEHCCILMFLKNFLQVLTFDQCSAIDKEVISLKHVQWTIQLNTVDKTDGIA